MQSSRALLAAHHQLAAEEKALRRRADAVRAAIVVDVYMHVVTRSTHVSPETLREQLRVLNHDFGPSRISFDLKAVDWASNAAWGKEDDYFPMMKALHKGGKSSLNLYFVDGSDLTGRNVRPVFADPTKLSIGQLLSTHFGVCTDPTDWLGREDRLFLDGCIISADTLPGGKERNYNQGKTATHEVGHWFGLLHTFAPDCYGDGDMVDDTPAAQRQSTDCSKWADSCPDHPGLDPVHNYMSYSFDNCTTEFTKGQTDRMHSLWRRYRA
ncbi:metalloprotease [Ophiocordyceps camponoti-floridani]|uniref:Metalloprotease n=1 Tax=Ophiocordyceps camponoti-floridani TaxID=2030778 RepID=A0A8H4VGE7_9HYPO|nr:metalloprotease [Ophiocordyceps camponoti-floridani]